MSQATDEEKSFVDKPDYCYIQDFTLHLKDLVDCGDVLNKINARGLPKTVQCGPQTIEQINGLHSGWVTICEATVCGNLDYLGIQQTVESWDSEGVEGIEIEPEHSPKQDDYLKHEHGYGEIIKAAKLIDRKNHIYKIFFDDNPGVYRSKEELNDPSHIHIYEQVFETKLWSKKMPDTLTDDMYQFMSYDWENYTSVQGKSKAIQKAMITGTTMRQKAKPQAKCEKHAASNDCCNIL